jgi:branched-chain amino acid transport system permease protein
MPDGVIPAVQGLLARFRPEQSSIREETAAELLERERADAGPADRQNRAEVRR